MSAAASTPTAPPPEEVRRSLEVLLFSEVTSPKDGEVIPLATYAVLDGASIPDLLDHLYSEQKRPEFVCLYRGELEPDMAPVAPYLVRLRLGEEFAEWLLGDCWGKHYGVFVRTLADLHTLRRHFRYFLRVRNPEGKVLHFRFYDPRVLNVYLPTCNAEELEFHFGPIDRWVCEAEAPPMWMQYSLTEEGELMVNSKSLTKPAEAPGIGLG